jgi:vacuolar-type H+-ATPase subunit H
MDEKILEGIKSAEKRAEEIIKDAEENKIRFISQSGKEAKALYIREVSSYKEEMEKYMEFQRNKIEEMKKEIEEERTKELSGVEKRSASKKEKALSFIAEEFEKVVTGD